LISAGGGAAGQKLIEIALKSHQHSLNKQRPWTFVTGPLAGHLTGANESVTIVRSLPDFRSRLAGAAVSISQAGYNTLVEAVAAGTPTIAVPFETDCEKEQRLRAEKFAARGWIKLMHQSELTPLALAGQIDALAGTNTIDTKLDINGGAASAAALEQLLKRS
jgi:predicted glycosyltransferase